MKQWYVLYVSIFLSSFNIFRQNVMKYRQIDKMIG